MRTKREIFGELAKLCAAQGYVHVIAGLSFRDNVVPYVGEMKTEDMQHMFSRSRLLRTEILEEGRLSGLPSPMRTPSTG